MARDKPELQKIQDPAVRQQRYFKRRNELLERAFELSELCDVDLALIMFSPAGKLSRFCGRGRRIEDVISRFAELPIHLRSTNLGFPNSDVLKAAVEKLNSEQEGEAHGESSTARSTDREYQDRNLPHCPEIHIDELRFVVWTTMMERDAALLRSRILSDGQLESLSSMSHLALMECSIRQGLLNLNERKQQLAQEELKAREIAPSTSAHAAQETTEMRNEGPKPDSIDGQSPPTNAYGDEKESHSQGADLLNTWIVADPASASMPTMTTRDSNSRISEAEASSELNVSYDEDTATSGKVHPLCTPDCAWHPCIDHDHHHWPQQEDLDCPRPLSPMATASQMTETVLDAHVLEWLYQSPVPATTAAAHGSQLKRRGGDDENSHFFFYHRVKTGPD